MAWRNVDGRMFPAESRPPAMVDVLVLARSESDQDDLMSQELPEPVELPSETGLALPTARLAVSFDRERSTVKPFLALRRAPRCRCLSLP